MIPQATIDQMKERIKGGECIESPEDLTLLSEMIAQIHIQQKASGNGRKAAEKKSTAEPTTTDKVRTRKLMDQLTLSIKEAAKKKPGESATRARLRENQP